MSRASTAGPSALHRSTSAGDHCVNARAKRAHAPPHAPRDEHDQNATWPTTEPADGAEPVVASRHSSTRVPQRREPAPPARSQSGSRLIGKNVPENRNSGNIPMRMMTGTRRRSPASTAQPSSGAANAERAEHRRRDREHAPERRHAAEHRGDDEEHRRRHHRAHAGPRRLPEVHVARARPASTPRRGTCRIHFTPPITGHSDSPAACITALAAIRPGRDELEVVDARRRRPGPCRRGRRARAHRGEEQQRREHRMRTPSRARAAATRPTRARRRATTRRASTSVLQRAAGEDQEDVLERAAPLRTSTRAARRRRRRARRSRRRRRCRRARGRPAPRSARPAPAMRGIALSRASPSRSAARRPRASSASPTSSRGDPSATMRPPSMITSRSHSCSASSM